jgi:hypothetical protein
LQPIRVSDHQNLLSHVFSGVKMADKNCGGIHILRGKIGFLRRGKSSQTVGLQYPMFDDIYGTVCVKVFDFQSFSAKTEKTIMPIRSISHFYTVHKKC